MTSSQARKALIVAALLGVPVALVSMALMEAIHWLEHAIWHDVPAGIAGWEQGPPWWYVVGVTTAAATLAAVLLSKVASNVSHELSLTPPPLRHLPWLLGGAVATLAGGLVLGPEAPLLALGIALMGVAARRTSEAAAAGAEDAQPYTTVLALAGAAIVLGMVLGSPLLAIVLMLEIVAASGLVAPKQVVPVLVPALLASGIGALVFTGVGEWSGIRPPTLAIPDLPPYPAVQWRDLLLAPLVGAVAALLVVATRRSSEAIAGPAARYPVRWTAGVGLVTGLLAVGYRLLTDRPIDDVLFSGQTALPDIVGIDSAWVLAALIAAKGAAYVLALVGRLEGGRIFPALAISGAVGTAAAIVLPGTSLTAMLVVATAAGTTALQRLPIFGVVFSLIIVAGASAFDLAPLAILGGVVGFVTAGLTAAADPAPHDGAQAPASPPG